MLEKIPSSFGRAMRRARVGAPMPHPLVHAIAKGMLIGTHVRL